MSQINGGPTGVVRAAFALGERELVLLFSAALDAPVLDPSLYSLESGVAVREVLRDPHQEHALRLLIDDVPALPLTMDRVRVDVKTHGGEPQTAESPQFIHGVHTPIEIKVPHLEAGFPFASTLVGYTVTVMCCTGCNGGVHDRNLVVVNSHAGGPWTGIWIQTDKVIEGPYPRWQRVLFAGGVIAEEAGSTAVVDPGWMIVAKADEPAHHAPPPLRIDLADLPVEQTTSLLTKGLDGTWVELNDVTVESVERVVRAAETPVPSLPHAEVLLSDNSGARSMVWLYQDSIVQEVSPGTRFTKLRGFVHAEAPGRYVLLSDKPEDLVV